MRVKHRRRYAFTHLFSMLQREWARLSPRERTLHQEIFNNSITYRAATEGSSIDDRCITFKTTL
jgi:hypothetical protein